MKWQKGFVTKAWDFGPVYWQCFRETGNPWFISGLNPIFSLDISSQIRARRYRTKKIHIANHGAPRIVTMLLRVCYLDLDSNDISNRSFFQRWKRFFAPFSFISTWLRNEMQFENMWRFFVRLLYRYWGPARHGWTSGVLFGWGGMGMYGSPKPVSKNTRFETLRFSRGLWLSSTCPPPPA